MRKITSVLAVAATLMLSSHAAFAQAGGYTGPGSDNQSRPQMQQATPQRYSGPSSVQLLTVEQLLQHGQDNQHARLQGRIISFDGGERYTFEDSTGRITVEIDDEDFPPGQSIGADQQVELWGELDKDIDKTEFEVDRVLLLQ